MKSVKMCSGYHMQTKYNRPPNTGNLVVIEVRTGYYTHTFQRHHDAPGPTNEFILEAVRKQSTEHSIS
jgi:hypothetical protein